MYGDNFKFSDRHIRSTKAYTEALINSYQERNTTSEENKMGSNYVYEAESRMIAEQTNARENIGARLQSFSNSVRHNLLIEALYYIFENSMDHGDKNTNTSTIMRSIVSEYVNENGYFDIMDRMKKASPTTFMIHKIITESHKNIMESVDKNNPDTFRIAPEMRDEFFKQLNYSDSQAVSDAINQRVADAMTDFVDSNTKDHEDITAVLKQAQEKIGDVEPEDDSLKEAYTRIANGKANDIRNRPKNVLHTMIHSMCESVLKHNELHGEFMTEGKLDVPSIVDRVKVMYTFMEMLNTSKIDVVDEAFINNVIKDLSN